VILKPCPLCNGELMNMAMSHRFSCRDCGTEFQVTLRQYINNRQGEREVVKKIVRALTNEAARSYRTGCKTYPIHMWKAAKLAAKEGGLVK
jgi:protein-arginine kinase activator protein McsA